MSTIHHNKNGATAEPGGANRHPQAGGMGVTDATLGAVCSRYLELRSTLEALDKEVEQAATELGRCNMAIANHLGPLDYPLVLQHEGMWLVINVAEGLLKPRLVSASVVEAIGPDDVLLDTSQPEQVQLRN